MCDRLISVFQILCSNNNKHNNNSLEPRAEDIGTGVGAWQGVHGVVVRRPSCPPALAVFALMLNFVSMGGKRHTVEA